MVKTIDLTGGFDVTSDEANGASAVAFSYDTAVNYSTAGAKLASWKNNNVEKVYLDKDGNLISTGNVICELVAVGNDTLTVDNTFFLGASDATTPITQYDAGDYVGYVRGGDYYLFVVDNAAQLTLSASAADFQNNNITTTGATSTANAVLSTGYTVATLPATTLGTIARVTDASAPAMGTTVAGGGAAAAMVWYNGTNWTVTGI